MSNTDRYQIGTPEMVRKDKLREARWSEIRRSEGFGAFMAILLAIGFGSMMALWVKGVNEMRAEQRAKEEALAAAHAQLEASCADKSGSLLEVKSGFLCLADNIIIFNVDDVLSEEARQITGAPAPLSE